MLHVNLPCVFKIRMWKYKVTRNLTAQTSKRSCLVYLSFETICTWQYLLDSVQDIKYYNYEFMISKVVKETALDFPL